MRWILVFKLTSLNELEVSSLGKQIPVAKFLIPCDDDVLPVELDI